MISLLKNCASPHSQYPLHLFAFCTFYFSFYLLRILYLWIICGLFISLISLNIMLSFIQDLGLFVICSFLSWNGILLNEYITNFYLFTFRWTFSLFLFLYLWVEFLSPIVLFVTPWTVAYQASLSKGYWTGESHGLVHGVANSWTRLSDFHIHFFFITEPPGKPFT